MRVTLVVPTRGAAGKSRLSVAGVDHATLARALALDTVAAALAANAVSDVVVVTADPAVTAALPAHVVRVSDAGAGLAAGVEAGLAAAPSASGHDGLVGVLLGDLPAAAPADVDAALEAAIAALAGPAWSAFVPDHQGTGTVLLVGRPGSLVPSFGPGSAARHERTAARLDLDLPGLRRDVDDAADLAAALAMGVGPATRAALRGRERARRP